MADPARARKLAVRIRQIVSAAIETQIKDPRLGMVTVTDARVTSDLREATVFYTVYGDETQIADSAAASFMARGEVDCVVTGADRIAANGDTANKIGTYSLAVLAAHHGIPLYVVAPSSTSCVPGYPRCSRYGLPGCVAATLSWSRRVR